MRGAREILTVLFACACLPATAQASPLVSLHASLKPERLAGHHNRL